MDAKTAECFEREQAFIEDAIERYHDTIIKEIAKTESYIKTRIKILIEGSIPSTYLIQRQSWPDNNGRRIEAQGLDLRPNSFPTIFISKDLRFYRVASSAGFPDDFETFMDELTGEKFIQSYKEIMDGLKRVIENLPLKQSK